jgi:two-component system response regulator HydG
MRELSDRYNRSIKSIAAEVRRMLTAYDWPGNVRELRHVIESMVAVDRDGILGVDDLPENERLGRPADAAAIPIGDSSLVGKPLADVERYYILQALDLSGGNRDEAARILGIGQRTMLRRIKEYQDQGYLPKRAQG